MKARSREESEERRETSRCPENVRKSRTRRNVRGSREIYMITQSSVENLLYAWTVTLTVTR
jgi:hypothetical protein